MAQSPILYTGRGLAAEIPKDGGGLGRLSDFIVQAETIKYKAFKENEQEFLKASNIDPIFFISKANQDAQTKLLEEFNQKWFPEQKRMTSEKKSQMQAEKNFVIMNQQKMQSDMERAMVDRDIISKDVKGDIDHEDANKRWADYILTGNYDISPLKPSAIDPDLQYSRNINKGIGTKSTVTVTKKKDGMLVTEKKVASGTEEEGRKFVEADILGNPRLAQGYIKKFQALKTTDPETYVKYLDTDLSGTVDASEEQAASTSSNPIIRWAQDNYWDKKLILEDAEVTKPETTGGNKGSSLFKGFGGTRYYDPTEARNVGIVGQTPYTTFHDIKGMPVQEATFNKGRVLNPEGEKSLEPNTPITSRVIGYDEDKDEFIFIATKNFMNLGSQFSKSFGEGLRFAVKRADLPDMYNDFDIIKNGKTVKVGSITRGTTPTQSTALKKKILVNGKWVYPEEAPQK